MWDYSLHPSAYFLRALANTLNSAFQYEVTYHSESAHELIVSGIGVAGLLRCLLGTYRIEGSYTGRDLAILTAVPLAEFPGRTETRLALPPVKEWDPGDSGHLHFEFDWTQVRGLLSEGVSDFATGTSIDFQESRQRWAWWWNDLLPIVEPNG